MKMKYMLRPIFFLSTYCMTKKAFVYLLELRGHLLLVLLHRQGLSFLTLSESGFIKSVLDPVIGGYSGRIQIGFLLVFGSEL